MQRNTASQGLFFLEKESYTIAQAGLKSWPPSSASECLAYTREPLLLASQEVLVPNAGDVRVWRKWSQNPEWQ